jgi:hypothetical protein
MLSLIYASRRNPVIYKYRINILRHASAVSWSEFLVTDPEVPSLIPGPTTFSEEGVWNGVSQLNGRTPERRQV